MKAIWALFSFEPVSSYWLSEFWATAALASHLVSREWLPDTASASPAFPGDTALLQKAADPQRLHLFQKLN